MSSRILGLPFWQPNWSARLESSLKEENDECQGRNVKLRVSKIKWRATSGGCQSNAHLWDHRNNEWMPWFPLLHLSWWPEIGSIFRPGLFHVFLWPFPDHRQVKTPQEWRGRLCHLALTPSTSGRKRSLDLTSGMGNWHSSKLGDRHCGGEDHWAKLIAHCCKTTWTKI